MFFIGEISNLKKQGQAERNFNLEIDKKKQKEMQQLKQQEKCQKHKGQFKNILLFDKNNIQTLLCLSCAQTASRNSNKIIDVNQFIYSEENSIFSNFPPFEDESLYESLNELLDEQDNNYKDKCIKLISDFFTKLKREIITKLEDQENKIKDDLISIFAKNDNLIDIYNRISQKNDLQNLYQNYDEQSSQTIKDIINSMYSNIQQNTHVIKEKIDEIKQVLNKFSLDQPNQVKNNIFQLIQQINFSQDCQQIQQIDRLQSNQYQSMKISFENHQKNLNQIELLTFEKSKNYKDSQQILIEKLGSNELSIRKTRDGFGVAYSNFILDPNKKYIFRLEIQPFENSSKKEITFILGLIKENEKDNNDIERGIRLSYCPTQNSQKSLSLSASNEQSNKNLEIRIHIQEQLFKVASLPRYNHIHELNIKDVIQQNGQYRFAILLFHSSNKFLINYFRIVDQFENQI